MIGMYDYSIDHWPPMRHPRSTQERFWPKGGKYTRTEEEWLMVPVFGYRKPEDNMEIYGARGYRYVLDLPSYKKLFQTREFRSGKSEAFVDAGPGYLDIAAVNIAGKVIFFKDEPKYITLKNKHGIDIPRNVRGSDIDAAFSYNQSVVIITGNYYYNMSLNDVLEGKNFTGPFAIFSKEYLLNSGCLNIKYRENKSFRNILNVSSRGDFYRFVNRFIKVPQYKPDIPVGFRWFTGQAKKEFNP